MCWCRQGGTGVDTLGTRAEQMNVVGLAKAWLWQVDRRGHRPALHLELAKKCAMVVAEEPFCVPFLKGVEELRAAPLWLLDCASVVPSALVPKGACHRAYAYEKATEYLHTKHAAHKWEDAKLEQGAVLDFELPPCNDLQHPDEVLLKDMEVDHSVAPVSHTPGGSSAGYARWNSWVAGGGLKTYAKRRNESLDVHGVSRMSAYLNAGMVSPMRIARLASTATGAGKSKFLNEFLTWRGICYSHFYHFPMPSSGATVAQLPPWAQQTLQEHAKDSRQVIPLEQLASAKSGDAAWDGMQRYLIETGELHNNARMGWGKAVCRWTEGPQAAIDALVALNNIFALDGHAPPSYGGLLGCLGLFEGPKQDSAILGKVSHRSPKAKYATLPDVAGELMRAGKQEAGIARFFGRAVENSLEPQPKRRWVRKLGPDGTIALDCRVRLTVDASLPMWMDQSHRACNRKWPPLSKYQSLLDRHVNPSNSVSGFLEHWSRPNADRIAEEFQYGFALETARHAPHGGRVFFFATERATESRRWVAAILSVIEKPQRLEDFLGEDVWPDMSTSSPVSTGLEERDISEVATEDISDGAESFVSATEELEAGRFDLIRPAFLEPLDVDEPASIEAMCEKMKPFQNFRLKTPSLSVRIGLKTAPDALLGLLDEPQPDHFPLHASFGELQVGISVQSARSGAWLAPVAKLMAAPGELVQKLLRCKASSTTTHALDFAAAKVNVSRPDIGRAIAATKGPSSSIRMVFERQSEQEVGRDPQAKSARVSGSLVGLLACLDAPALTTAGLFLVKLGKAFAPEISTRRCETLQGLDALRALAPTGLQIRLEDLEVEVPLPGLPVQGQGVRLTISGMQVSSLAALQSLATSVRRMVSGRSEPLRPS
ncbi:unnamed protein product [Effrenium voratum]|nr:unnamed protein product [Effrenium voratum]